MAVNVVIAIKGVTGESSREANSIDVMSFSWGMNQTATLHTQSGGTAGMAEVRDLVFTKVADKSTPTLMKMCCSGQHIESAVMKVFKAGGDKPLPYMVITMNPVVLRSVDCGETGPNDQLIEHVSLNFRQFKVEYTPQGDKGTAMGGAIVAAWNIAENKSAG